MSSIRLLITRKRITFTILFILLSVIIIGSFLNTWLSVHKTSGYWIGIWYLCIGYTLCSIAIWLNKDDLQCLNIDANFMVIFIFIGALTSYALPFWFGIFLGFVTLYNFIQFRFGGLRVAEFYPKRWVIISLIVLSLIPTIFGVWQSGMTISWSGKMDIFNSAFKANITQVVIEEFVFRGMLWMFLRNFNLEGGPVIIIQAFLFWFIHQFYFFSNPVVFWIYLPVQSIFYGIIVWRAKSITPSFWAHFLNNLIVILLR